MDILSLVKRNSNLSTLLIGVGSVLAGTGAAAVRGNMELLSASICVLFAMFCQLGANLGHHYLALNRYYENKPNTKLNEKKWRGDELEVRVFREGAFVCMIIAGMLGLTLMTMSGQVLWTILLAFIIIGSAVLLNLGKHPLFGTPWSLLFTWFIFGPVAVIGSSIIQTQHEAVAAWGLYDLAPSLFLGPAMGLLAVNIHLLFSYSMIRLGIPGTPRSVVKIIGPKAAEALMIINGFLMMLIVIFEAFYLDLPDPGLLSVPVFLGSLFNLYGAVRMRRAPMGELVHLGFLMKLNFLLTGLLTLLIWWYVGAPDDSMKVLF